MRRLLLCLTVCLAGSATLSAEVTYQVIRGARVSHSPAEGAASIVASKDDLLAGLIPVVEPRGLNRDAPDVSVWTDGKTYDEVAMPADGPVRTQTGTSTPVTFALRKPSDVQAICVFSGWGDARALQDYDVEVSTDTSCVFRPVIQNVRVAKEGVRMPKIRPDQHHFAITVIGNDNKQPVAKGVRQIRFIFWGVEVQSSQGTSTASRNRGHWGSAISEIDVLSTPVAVTDVDADSGSTP